MSGESTSKRIETEIGPQNKYEVREIQPFTNLTIQSLISDSGTITRLSERIDKGKAMKKHTSPPSKKIGTNFKLLRACSFCRRRKLKCIMPHNSYKCEECIAREQECIFNHKIVQPGSRRSSQNKTKLLAASAKHLTASRIEPSSTLFSKRNMEVDSIAQHIPPTIENKSYSLSCDIVQPSGYHVMESIPQREESRSEHGTENEKGDMSLRNEENLPINDSSSLTWYSKEKLDHSSLTNQNGPSIIGSSPSLDGFSPACADEFSILSSSRREEIGMLSFNIYKIHIEPYTPFVSYDMFNSTDSGYLDHFSKFCIHLASVSSSTNQIPLSTIDLLFEVFKGYMEDDSRYIFDEVTLSFFLLLPLRIRISDNIVQKHLGMFNKFYEKNGNSLPINLLVGALTVDAFYSLLKGTWVLTTNTSILKEVSNFVGTLNKKCFNYHYLSVACFLYKLIMVVSNIKLSYEEQRIEMLHLEYEMLLWPAKLTRELSVVEDDLLATPEAFFLHVIHNTLLIEFYSNALRYKNKFGKMNSIFAVPGLYQFIAGMAKSNFRLNEGLVGRWSLIANCQLHTAKLLLGLYEVMEFEEFISALRFYKKSTNVFDYEFQDHIFSQVQKLLTKNSSYKLSDDDKDGPKVFWVFRDVRSMSLQLYIDESKERLH